MTSLEGFYRRLPTLSLLLDHAVRRRAAYAKARPYPHTVIDGLFPPAILRGVLEEFPSARPDPRLWKSFDNPFEKKLGSLSEHSWGPRTRAFMHYLNSQPFVQFLEVLTGIEGLTPDPHFDGGGLHQSVRGGFLKIHADFNRHETLRLDRRLNLLIYLNEGWRSSWGGRFEMWDRKMRRCIRKVSPVFNRTVVFSTTSTSFHGHPTPMDCPPGRARRSLALYYYTAGRPRSEVPLGDHDTLFRLRPQERP